MQINKQATRKQLEAAESILITSHVHTDGDAIGSCLALAHVLKGMGRQVQVVLDDHVQENYDIMSGIKEVQRYDGESLEADLIVLLDARLEYVCIKTRETRIDLFKALLATERDEWLK